MNTFSLDGLRDFSKMTMPESVSKETFFRVVNTAIAALETQEKVKELAKDLRNEFTGPIHETTMLWVLHSWLPRLEAAVGEETNVHDKS